MKTMQEWENHFKSTYPQPPCDMTSEQNRAVFDDTMEMMKDMVRPFMNTKEGRDQIRRTFHCKIEGYENE